MTAKKAEAAVKAARIGAVGRRKEAIVRVGFVFLMMVVVFVLYNDIAKMLPQG